jgi:hypothetical protein
MPTRERDRSRDHCEKDATRKMSPGDGLVRESVIVIEITTHISATDNEQWHRERQGLIVEEDVSV